MMTILKVLIHYDNNQSYRYYIPFLTVAEKCHYYKFEYAANHV